MNKKLLLLDYDDTLVDTVGSRVPAIIEFCRSEYNAIVTFEEIATLWGTPFDQMMHGLGCHGRIDPKVYADKYASKYPIKPFAESDSFTLETSQEIELGILTSVAREVLHKDLEALGWDDGRFSFLFAQEDTLHHKPDPRVFDQVLERVREFSISKEDIMYTGDRLSDARAAIDAGIDFFGMARNANQKQMFKNANIAYRVDLFQLMV